MKNKLSLLIITICCSFTSSTVISGQTSKAIQFSGGIISPMSSSKGLSASAQFNYSLNTFITVYSYLGYSAWDKYYIYFYNNNRTYKTYSEAEHLLIPFYIGSSINLHTNKHFTTYLNFELGYSYLSYNSYGYWISANPETGKISGYFADHSSIKKNRQNLFGIGIGSGLSHPITKKADLTFTAKLNSYLNSNYSGLFSERGTYLTFIMGFNFVM